MIKKTGYRGQNSWGQECWGSTAGKGQLRQNIWNKKSGLGELEKTVGIVHVGQDREDRMARI
jgi:hypothetical protein